MSLIIGVSTILVACVAPAIPRTSSAATPARAEPVKSGPVVATATINNNIRTEPPKANIGKLSPELQQDVANIWRQFPGKTGIAVMDIDSGAMIGHRLDEFFPQQSVSKLWVAMTVLDLVDQKKLRLDQKVRITKNDLAVFHQPIRAKVLAEGEIYETVQSLLEQAITASDNTANDSLLRTAGGPNVVKGFIARRKLGNIRFGPGERAMQSAIAGLDWRQDYAIGRRFYAARAELPLEKRKTALDAYLANPIDGASPNAIVHALARLKKGEMLSAASTKLLLDIMGRVKSGPRRLKAGVPADWSFVHKTGTGQELSPIATGYNDVGIMTAPDGKSYAVAVMISNTTASIPARMEMMQGVTRTVAHYHKPE